MITTTIISISILYIIYVSFCKFYGILLLFYKNTDSFEYYLNAFEQNFSNRLVVKHIVLTIQFCPLMFLCYFTFIYLISITHSIEFTLTTTNLYYILCIFIILTWGYIGYICLHKHIKVSIIYIFSWKIVIYRTLFHLFLNFQI